MTETQDRLEERLRELDLVIEQLRNEGYHDWPDILTRTRAALRQSQDIEADVRLVLAGWGMSAFVMYDHKVYDAATAAVEQLRAALVPKAEEAPR